MDRKPYRVTDLAGTHVAGIRIADRADDLWLTDDQAIYELLAGTIVPPAQTLHFSEGTGEVMVAIPASADGIMREVTLGRPGAPEAEPADSVSATLNPRSKKR